MPIVNVNGLKLFYKLSGSGEPLLLIGGLTRNHTIWDEVVNELNKNFSVITFDNRGTGQSDKPDIPYRIEHLAEDVHGLFQALSINKVNIVGHSMGAFMAMHFAAKYPEQVKSLVLCSACTVQPASAINYLTERMKLVESKPALDDAIRAALPWIYSANYLADQDRVEAIVAKEKANPYPQPPEIFIRQAEACKQHDARAIIAKIKAPTLVMGSVEDRITTPDVVKALAEAIPQASLVMLPQAGHMLQIEITK